MYHVYVITNDVQLKKVMEYFYREYLVNKDGAVITEAGLAIDDEVHLMECWLRRIKMKLVTMF